MNDLLRQCSEKLAELNALRPLDPEQELRIMQKLRLDWDFHSNHLEGNSLTYGETKALILHGLTAQGKPIKDHIEITGHHEAILLIEDLVRRKQPLTENVIRQLHQLILHDDHPIEAVTETGIATTLLVEVGKYKTAANHVKTVTGEILLFSSPTDVPIHMQELIGWYRSSDGLHPIEIATVFHHRFTRIHPFTDGNGRVARLLSNFILMMNGYPPVVVKTQEKEAYFSALRLADAGNTAAFAEYLSQRLILSLDLVIRGARGESIEDADDVLKEVALLRQQFESGKKKVNVVRSNEVAQAAWSNWISWFLLTFEQRSHQFDAFYLSHVARLGINGDHPGDDIGARMEFAVGKLASAREISMLVQFSAVRIRLHADKTYQQAVRVVLLQTHMEVHLGDGKKVAEVDWDAPPSKEQMLLWMSAEEKRHLNFIRPLIADA